MNFVKLLLVLAIVGAGYHFYEKRHEDDWLKTAKVSANGFMELPAPSNLDMDGVIVFAALNCTKEAAQRADEMADALKRRNIPTKRAQSINFQFSEDPGPHVVKRINSVLKGELPIVFVNGKGKANPTLDEVLSEYGRS